MFMRQQSRPTTSESLQKIKNKGRNLRSTVLYRQPVVSNTACSSEASARVRGDCERVFIYATNIERWPEWYPGVLSAARTNASEGPHASIGAKFALQQEIAGFKTWTMYKVRELENNKRIVWSHNSDLHDAIDQLVFMSDPMDPTFTVVSRKVSCMFCLMDPTFTVVRYMSSLKLKDWRATLQPMVSGTLAKIPEKAINNLQRLLNTTNTLSSVIIPGQKSAPSRASTSTSSAPAAKSWVDLTGPWSSMPSSMQQLRFPQSWGSLFGGANGMKNNTGIEISETFKEASSRDPLGYYKTLGLNPESASQEEIKSAFRRLAQTMHPDKVSIVKEEDRVAALSAFQAVQSAYEVLRSPESRAAYDSGLLNSPRASPNTPPVYDRKT
ncbi:hypothetical protein CEUSTIGMA_g4301.t1 [Chlamydomonas eustigma]|uniref:J domain-containing protein n=1 Tax=Chlamydomonas eustigma TaxID=1157962 RepID=A0A250X1C2_9CHLO|nr:hypothetical protein CEUSTIGMA_g4301.t1 [Chlamydomonas eustigma]|eukprot:GAX76855.1 hypothetical protein CEUSTIGMA_g4301.t1 [Chlamydomonas eustigma]